jgi:hypothetical protein
MIGASAHDIEAGGHLDHLHRQVKRIARTAHAVVERSGPRLGELDQVGDRLHHRKMRACHQDQCGGRQLGDGDEVDHRIKWKLAKDRGRNRLANRRLQNGVPVRSRLRDQVGSDVAPGPHPVLDHHGLLELFRQPGADHARQQIDRASRGERHENSHRSVRVILRECGSAGAASDAGHRHERELYQSHRCVPSSACEKHIP